MRTALRKSAFGVVVLTIAVVVALLPGFLSGSESTEVSIAAAPTAVSSEPVHSEPTQVPTTEPVELPLAEAPVLPEAPPVLLLPEVTPTPTPAPAEDPTLDADPEPAAASVIEASDSADSANRLAVDVGDQSPAPTATTPPVAATVEPTTAPTSTPVPTATALPTPQPTSTPEPTSTPSPAATAVPTATSAPTATATPEPTRVSATTVSVDSDWLYVDSDTGLLLRSEPAGTVVRALAHRSQVFATGRILAADGREWMQIESPARGWVARSFLTSEQPAAPVVATVPSGGGDGQAPTAADWAGLRKCESGGNYAIVSSNGLYHGAYQFLPSTWDSIAGRNGRNDLVGVLPSLALPADQDAMAQALYALQGASPWPVCGQSLL